MPAGFPTVPTQRQLTRESLSRRERDESTMRVCLFADSFASRRGFGIARYCHQLHFALSQHFRGEMLRLSLGPSNPSDASLYTPLWSRRVLAGAWAFLSAPDVRHWVGDVDVVHSLETGYPVATQKPLITTVHDLGPLTHPEYFSASHPWLIRRALEQAATRASAIICPSTYTAEAMQSFAGCSLGERLCVIPHGVSPCFFEVVEDARAGSWPERLRQVPYLLFTGSVSPRKNLERVLRAFESLVDRIPHQLVLAGSFAWSSDQVAREVRGRLRERVVVTGYVDEAQLVWLYQHASAYVYPSLLEGFGLPVLEAMAAGCPVLTSNGSSLREVAGGCAQLVDPLSVESIRAGILTLLEDDDNAQRRSELGRRHARTFTWDRVARSVATLYQRAVEIR